MDTSEVYQMRALDLPINSRDIKPYTQKDPVLANKYKFIQSGEWTETKGEFTPYYRRRYEISTQAGCLSWGSRVIIPPRIQNAMLSELHETHMGVVKTKSLARSHVFPPGIDQRTENMCKSCHDCIAHLKAPRQSELFPYRLPDRPWWKIP